MMAHNTESLGKNIHQIQIGDKAEYIKTMTEENVCQYAEISGDHNRIHLDENYAKTTKFGTRIVHGMLVAGMFSAILGTELPGLGTIYAKQEISFLAPVFFNDTIRAVVEVEEINVEKNRVKCKTVCYNQNDKIVISGYAIVLPPKSI